MSESLGGSPATRHHLRSVSDLYAADEIEKLLLEEIRDLQPPPSAYSRPEDIEDFEIAGSRTGELFSSQFLELDSPGVHSTVHSWDSHANYHIRHGDGDHGHGSSPNLAWNHLVFYCDIQGHLKTATGVVRLLLLISSAACLATLCSSGTAKVSLFMLPLVGRLRFMIFVAVFCFLITALLLFLDISHVIYVFPLNWAKLNAWIFTGIGLSYALGSALLAFSIWEYHAGGWVPRRTRSQLSAAAALGLSCALLAFLLSWIHGRTVFCKGGDSRTNPPTQLYKPVDNSSSSGVTLKERSPKRGKRKDHWASAREHFLPDDDVDEIPKKDIEIERRRRRRRTDGDSNSTADGHLISKPENSHVTGEPKPRRVPQKLALHTIQQPAPWPTAEHRDSASSEVRSKTMQLPVNNNAQVCNDITESKSMQASLALHWEVGCGARNGVEETAISVTRTAMWTGQWQPPPDDVQPCSSKTVEPYSFA